MLTQQHDRAGLADGSGVASDCSVTGLAAQGADAEALGLTWCTFWPVPKMEQPSVKGLGLN